MVKQMEDIETLAALLKGIDVFLVAETWLSEKTAPTFNLMGYEALHNFRKSKRAGGVSIFTRYGLGHEQEAIYQNSIEAVKMTIIKGDSPITILLIYNPPNNTTETLIDELAPILETLPKNSLINGDFNTDAYKDNHPNLLLSSTMSSYGFTLCNSVPTRLSTTCNTLTDHIYTNNMASDIQVDNIQNDLSDHRSYLLISTTISMTAASNTSPRMWNSINANKLNKYLESTKLITHESEGAEEIYQRFIKYINVGINESTTVRRLKNIDTQENFAPWIDDEYLNLTRRKETLYQQKKKHPHNNIILEDYKSVRNAVTAMKKKKKEQLLLQDIRKSPRP